MLKGPFFFFKRKRKAKYKKYIKENLTGKSNVYKTGNGSATLKATIKVKRKK